MPTLTLALATWQLPQPMRQIPRPGEAGFANGDMGIRENDDMVETQRGTDVPSYQVRKPGEPGGAFWMSCSMGRP